MNNSKTLQEIISEAAKVELSKLDVWEFCLYHDYELFSKRPYLKIIAYSFQWMIQKESTPKHIVDYVETELKDKKYYWSGKVPHKIGVSLPPRAGKSYVISCCSAWLIGKYPTESIMRNACTERLYQKFSYDVREIIKSEKFKNVFPEVTLSVDKSAVSGWNVKQAKQVSYFGAGVGGTIIGFGASKIAITDDLYKSMIDALSTNTIEKVALWKESAHDTRLEKGCPEIDIGTRWSKKDVLGISEKDKEYDLIIRVPALIDGKSFCEDVKSTEEYLKIEKKIPSFLWKAGYQQQPAELAGSCFPLDRLNRFKLSDIQGKEGDVISVTDVADQGKDYLCTIIGKIIGQIIYIVDVVYTKKDSDYTIPAIIAKFKQWDISKAIFESNNQGLQFTKNLKNALKEENLIALSKRIIALPNTQNKHSRIIIQSMFVINNFAFRDDITLHTEYQEYLEHLCDYMKDKPVEPDDAADSTSGMAKWFGNSIT